MNTSIEKEAKTVDGSEHITDKEICSSANKKEAETVIEKSKNKIEQIESDIAHNKKKKFTAFDLVLLPILGVIIYVAKLMLSFLPNIHPVCVLIVVYMRVFGPKSIISVYIFVMLDMLTYGVVTSISYLYVWLIFALIVLCFSKVKSVFFWSSVSAIFGLLFGALTAIPNLILYGVPAAITYWIAGLSFDLMHCISNFIVCILLYWPFYILFGTLNKKFQEQNVRIFRG